MFFVFTSGFQQFQTLRAMCTEDDDFHWIFTTVFYQQIENSERASQIHGFTIDYMLIYPLSKFGSIRTNSL